MKIRASQIGKIMGTSRTKGEPLSQTAKSYIKELVIEELFGITPSFWSRYTDKGNEVEDEAILLAEEVLELGFVTKNDEYFKNDYIKGTPDVITKDLIVDVKSSWSALTFPFFEDEIPNKDYFYQLQGYMWLTGRRKAILAYCLINTPEDYVQDEIRRESWKRKEIDVSDDTIRDVMAIHNFDSIPKHRRIKHYEVDYCEKTIEQIKEKVELCREYYNKLKSEML